MKAKTKANKGPGASALRRIQRLFPSVTNVTDATAPVIVRVDSADVAGATPKNPSECALARACRRHRIADGAIVGIGTTWLIRGDTAIRFNTSVGIGREITSFDRHKEFAPGADYRLESIPPSNRMEEAPWRSRQKKGKATGERSTRRIIHHTANIRVIRDTP